MGQRGVHVNKLNNINGLARDLREGNILKPFRFLCAILGTIGLMGMFSCGGSSYLSEYPPLDETMSTGTYTAGGATERYSMSLTSKDLVLVHVEGDADGYGESHFDAGIHYCFFEFDSATLPAGHIQIKSSAAECSGIVDCGYCEATQVDYPDCAITCTINTSAHSGLVGEYLEIRYVDKLLMFSDAEGSSGGALRIEGERLASVDSNNLFDSTTRDFTIVDGGLVLDQLTPLTDVQTTDKFDYTLQITDMILDPNASSHDPVLLDNTAWTDIESRVTAQLPLTDLAVPSTTVNLDAGHYASNAAFWHDMAEEHDVLAFLVIFDELMEFQTGGVESYENCATAWSGGCDPVNGDAQCLPYDTERTAGTSCELVCMDTGASSPLLAHQAVTDQAACQALGGDIYADIAPFCLPTQLGSCLDEYPIGSGSSDHYEMDEAYSVEDDGTGSDKTTDEYLAAIFDSGTTEDHLIDEVEQCESSFGNYRALMGNFQFLGDINQASASCMAVAQRFIDDPTLSADSRTINGEFGVEFETVDTDEYIKIFFFDSEINPNHPMAGYWDSDYGEKQLFWDQVVGIERTWLGAPAVDDGVSVVTIPQADRKLYARDGLTYVEANIQISWIDQANLQARGDEINNDYLIMIQLEQDSYGNECGDASVFAFYGEVIGSEIGTGNGCDEIDQYNRQDGYMAPNSSGYEEEESTSASMATIFHNTVYANYYGAADWTTSEKTLRDKWYDCMNNYGSHLAAIPYYRNTADINTDDSIDDVCRNVAQRFVSTALGPEGVDQVLTAYPLRIEYVNSGTSAQGLRILILDGSVPGTSVFEDISGEYLVGDDTKIPAADVTYNGSTQWFDATDQRVSLSINQAASGSMSDHPMSIYTTGGVDYEPAHIDGFIKVSTQLDFHRIRELDLHEPDPENVYLLIMDLNEPVDEEGKTAEQRCNFMNQFVIDGTCECELDDSC